MRGAGAYAPARLIDVRWLLGPPVLVVGLAGLGRDRLLARRRDRGLLLPALACGRRGRTLAAVAWLLAPWRSATLRRRSGLLRSTDRLLPTSSDGLPAGREGVGETPHLGAEQLADLGQVRGDALLLPRQVVDLALRRGPVPFDLALGVGQELFGLALRRSDDLI